MKDALVQYFLTDPSEVIPEGSDNRRHTLDKGFQEVLTAQTGQTATHEGSGCQRIGKVQFTKNIPENDPTIACLRARAERPRNTEALQRFPPVV